MSKNKRAISDFLMVNSDLLNKVDMVDMNNDDLGRIKSHIFPSFCYDNAFVAAVKLNLETIVYGVAYVDFGGTKVPIEHAWVKTKGGVYHDPTYQMLNQNTSVALESEYYSLFELPLDEYIDLAEKFYKTAATKLIAPDFFAFRQHKSFKEYFTQ